jgi:hypothetical protein
VQVYAGRDPRTGRKRWVSRQVSGQTKRSYREAKKIEAELLEQVDRGQHRGSSSRTVAELIERWLGPQPPATTSRVDGAEGAGLLIKSFASSGDMELLAVAGVVV